MNMNRNVNKAMEAPIYDGIESPNKYFARLKAYVSGLQKDNYKVIIDLCNIWLSSTDIKLKGLLDFKKISKSKLPNDSSSDKLLNEYKDKILTTLKIKHEIKETGCKGMLELISIALKSIKYKLSTTNIKGVDHYTIVNTIKN